MFFFDKMTTVLFVPETTIGVESFKRSRGEGEGEGCGCTDRCGGLMQEPGRLDIMSIRDRPGAGFPVFLEE